jgi:hypothetical protein
VHRFLSINDSDIHGSAKTQLRASSVDFSDSWEPTLRFMEVLDSYKTAQVKPLWDRNLFLDGREISDDAVLQLVSARENRSENLISLFDQCRKQYLKFKVLSGTKEAVCCLRQKRY